MSQWGDPLYKVDTHKLFEFKQQRESKNKYHSSGLGHGISEITRSCIHTGNYRSCIYTGNYQTGIFTGKLTIKVVQRRLTPNL